VVSEEEVKKKVRIFYSFNFLGEEVLLDEAGKKKRSINIFLIKLNMSFIFQVKMLLKLSKILVIQMKLVKSWKNIWLVN
jgi:hypothetical protein